MSSTGVMAGEPAGIPASGEVTYTDDDILAALGKFPGTSVELAGKLVALSKGVPLVPMVLSLRSGFDYVISYDISCWPNKYTVKWKKIA